MRGSARDLSTMNKYYEYNRTAAGSTIVKNTTYGNTEGDDGQPRTAGGSTAVDERYRTLL